MDKIAVVGCLVLGIGFGYAAGATRAEAAWPVESTGRYLPTMASAADGAVTQFCMTDSWTGDSVCTEGIMYDSCYDETGQQSTECDVPDRKYFVVRGPFRTQSSVKLGR